ncbi:hypothetical protein OBV_18190 [Oscillibacter valericigenes Sjm18-20]|nr:hypothetical protein OBV_18190 [Oscillibacter valericigenes Sjm18-20]
MADGSIIFSTALDNKELEKQYQSLAKKIDRINEKIMQNQAERAPLAGQSKQIAAELDAAKARLEYMKSGQEFFTSSQIEAQATAAKETEKSWGTTQAKVERYDAAINSATIELDRSKERAGAIAQELADAGYNAETMNKATKRANKSMGRFALRVREVVRSALVFTLITQALAKFREWVGKVIKTNSEASAAVARLKGALLTLAQPLVNIIIPAFTVFVNILSKVISTIAQAVSMLFGSTAKQSAQAAKSLYDETAAIGKTGEAAKKASKSLADFDEINKLSGDSASTSTGTATSSEIEPDFSAADNGWLKNTLGDAAGMVTAALFLGGIALIAIGACTGSLSTVIAGLLLLNTGVVVGADTGVFQSWADTLGLNNVEEFVAVALTLGGIAMVAIGAAMGNILFVIAGLALIGYVIYQAEKNGTLQSWVESLGLDKAPQYITAALLIGGMTLIVIGAITHNVLMTLAGIGLLTAGVAVGTESGVIQNWWEALHLPEYAQWITPALLVGGMALLVFGIVMKNIFMLIGGFALLSAGVKFGTDSGVFANWWEVLCLPQVAGWVEAALLLGGIALVCFGVSMLNILMLIAGMSLLGFAYQYGVASGAYQSWWDAIGLPEVPGWVATALQLGGIALIAFGMFTLNLPLLIAGLALLSVSVAAKSASTSSTIDTEYSKKKWTGAGRDVVDGLNDGLDTMGDSGKKWGQKVVGDIADGLEVHSPSEATRRDGNYLVQGLINGVNEYDPQLQATLQTVFNGMQKSYNEWQTNFLTGWGEFQTLFSGQWTTFWFNIHLSFVSQWNNILDTLQAGVNSAITALNELVAAANSLAALTGISYSSVPLVNVEKIPIPALATGAVIPPNREFMAVLGDQKSGTNIEAPLDTIVQAVMLALSKSNYGSSSGQVIENAVYLDGEVIYKNQKKISKVHGKNLAGK